MKHLFLFLFLLRSSLISAQTGNVGINTSHPQATLHVNGTMRIDSVAKGDTLSKVLALDGNGMICYRSINYAPPFVCGDTLVDVRDGQTYPTVLIGSQCWMAKNLNYRTNGGSWYYLNDSAQYAAIHGRMYNWATFMGSAPSSTTVPSGVRGVCPTGWHVPSNEELNIFVMFGLKGWGNGGVLKETSYWNSPNAGATNYARFNARAGGNMSGGSPASSGGIGIHVEYWISTESSGNTAHGLRLNKDNTTISNIVNFKHYGLYCRCVKD